MAAVFRTAATAMKYPEMEFDYSIIRYPHGILVVGGIPMSEMETIAQYAKSLGYDKIYPGISGALDGSLAISNVEEAKEWKDCIDVQVNKKFKDNEVQGWANGPDSGISSLTIAWHLTKDPHIRTRFSQPSHPHDGIDFGRCVRLLDKFPHLREQLDEMSELGKYWEALVERWTQLEIVYHEELEIYENTKKVTGKTFKLMRKILDGVRGDHDAT